MFSLICCLWAEDNRIWLQRQNVPASVAQVFSAKKLYAQYEFAFTLNPFYLRGDFNGDGEPETALLVKNKKSGKVGIAICHGGKDEVFFVGAGTTIEGGGDGFSWMDNLAGLCAGAGAGKLVGEALSVEKSESGGGLTYWEGKTYKWQQHGD